jgi:hypothetical protein
MDNTGPTVKNTIRDLAEELLTGDYSHLLVGMAEEDSRGELLHYLQSRNISVEEESTIQDDQGRDWLVLSVSLPDISQLVLELIEKGFSSNIKGINARKSDRN